MQRNAYLFIGSIAALTASAFGFSSRVQPGCPTTDDSITVIVAGTLGGADRITDTTLRREGNTLFVRLTIDMCTGVCPLSIVSVEVRLPVGRLPAGTYRLITTAERIYASPPADTVTTDDTTQFEVYSSGTAVPRLVGLYVAPYAPPADSHGFYVTNGDTLSVVGALWANCCAKLAGEIARWNDTLLEVVLRDTSAMMCRCADMPFLVTAALRNVPETRVHLVYRRSVWTPEEIIARVIAKRSAPALCVNLAAATESGFCFYADGTARTYEVLSPCVGRPQVIRIAPNNRFHSPNESELYADNITYNGTVLEDFETFTTSAWTIVRARDGSGLTADTVRIGQDHWLRLGYSNFVTGFCNNYLWRPVEYAGRSTDTARLAVKAALQSPAVGVGAVHPYVMMCPERGITFRIACRGTEFTFSLPPEIRSPDATVEVHDVRGRLVARRNIRAGQTLALDTEESVAAARWIMVTVKGAGDRAVHRVVAVRP